MLLGMTIWGAARDRQSLRATVLMTEIDRLRSHAARTVGRIERDLENLQSTDLSVLDQQGWLRRHWQRTVPNGDGLSYAAIIDNRNNVVLHSDPAREGEKLDRQWYERILLDIGEDVVLASSPTLIPGTKAFDVRVLINVDGQDVGEYHAGLDVQGFETQLDQRERELFWRNVLLVGTVLVVVLLAGTSLYYVARHSLVLREQMEAKSFERTTAMSRMAAGLAHEVRNPLHAIQLNLHAFRRAHERGHEIPAGEVTNMLGQSSREIDRIEGLLRQMLGFAAPEEPRNEELDLAAELQSVVDFIDEEMLRSNIEVVVQRPSELVPACFDRGRFRQIMLNLLENAQQAMPDGGRIEITLIPQASCVEIAVADRGPGIPEAERQHIFEPFYSTKQDGSGLGLAIVKRFVEEMEGNIDYEINEYGGTTFRILLQQAPPGRTKGSRR